MGGTITGTKNSLFRVNLTEVFDPNITNINMYSLVNSTETLTRTVCFNQSKVV